MEQSQEMLSLCSAYETLFGNLASDLNGVNASWSDLLSNNFSGKIGSAQKAFTGALTMLRNSANSTRSVAETAQEMDRSWAGKIGMTMFNPDFLSGLLALKGQEIISDGAKVFDMLDVLKEKYKDAVPSTVRSWIEYLGKEADDAFFDKKLGDYGKAIEITEKLFEGDYQGAVKTATKTIVGHGLKEAAGDLGKYYLNLGWDGGTALGELVMEPSWKNVGNLAWNLTVQPVLDTAGSEIEDVIKLIPGISEYYYDEHGAEGIGDVAGVALGEFYSLFTPDEGIKEYGANYYKDGIWEGLWGGFEDIGSFIKDSGGVGEAAKSFFDTAWKDSKENFSYISENAEILWESLSKVVVGSEIPANGGGAW